MCSLIQGVNSKMNIGKNITTLRTNMGMTQEELADKLFVSRQTVSKWESDTMLPSIENLANISKLFNCNFEDLCLHTIEDIKNFCDLEKFDKDIHSKDFFLAEQYKIKPPRQLKPNDYINTIGQIFNSNDPQFYIDLLKQCIIRQDFDYYYYLRKMSLNLTFVKMIWDEFEDCRILLKKDGVWEINITKHQFEVKYGKIG